MNDSKMKPRIPAFSSFINRTSWHQNSNAFFKSTDNSAIYNTNVAFDQLLYELYQLRTVRLILRCY